ncbi:serine/threonine-protein kinase [Paractinoplanes atraurantiacus]|uniref:Serine/threonine protein kinase n=1 Tax=Paractinoplanes atraurantiacus TaxID=1036182 RepID=A0A285ILZ1_9ACTN|nr:serine/threonine-protein kinase [Actinoplanes atraurantiacus]SNY48954.1 serine/threonine protein kinase [Actinoplanes atraurantiacus]
MQSSPSVTGGIIPAEAATADLSGRCVGNSYVLVCPVGHGATGTVWRGIDRATGADVAVKLLHEGLLRQPKLVIRFVQERTILMMMRHENIVGVRDLFSVGGSLALVMDYVSGGSLRQYVRAMGTLPPADAAELLAQVAAALTQAHELGVVHRDVKPDNILLQENAGRFEVRLTDFGIARVLDTAGLTTPQAIVGTPHYMAPEAIQGEASPASDVYAVGVVLYELITGSTPYAGEPLAVLRGHLDEQPACPPGVVPAAWELIAWCLAKDPDRRPSAAELVAALRELARETAGVPALAGQTQEYADSATASLGLRAVSHPSSRPAPSGRKRPRNGPRTWKWRRPGMMVALIGLAVAVSGVGGFNAWQLLDSPGSGAAAPPQVTSAAPSAAIPGRVKAPQPPPAAAAGLPQLSGGLEASGGGLSGGLSGGGMSGGGGSGPAASAEATPERQPDARVSVGPTGIGVTAGPGRAEAKFGPWRCGDEYSWDLGHPVLAKPCHALGGSVRVAGQMEAMPGVQTDIELTVRDAATDEVVAGPYLCKGLMFTDFALRHTCGPGDLRPEHGDRSVVVALSWRYTQRPLLPGGVTRGPAFRW